MWLTIEEERTRAALFEWRIFFGAPFGAKRVCSVYESDNIDANEMLMPQRIRVVYLYLPIVGVDVCDRLRS